MSGLGVVAVDISPILGRCPKNGDRFAYPLEGRGPVVMAVDKLPTELPRPASQAFGDALALFAPILARSDFDAPFDRLGPPAVLAAAVIAHRGSLTPSFDYLSDHL